MMGGRKRDSIVSDALESLIGAMYLDGGFEPAQAFVMKFILNDLEDKRIFYDSKTVLQEMVQEGGNHPVEYRLLKEEGPDHSKSFTVEALINGKSMGTGTGHTKKAAEQAAALEAIRSPLGSGRTERQAASRREYAGCYLFRNGASQASELCVRGYYT